MIDRVSRNMFLGLVVFVAALAGCGPQPTSSPTPLVVEDVMPLPAPSLSGQMSLEEALTQRRSIREFSDTPLTLTEMGQLLWAAQGITHERGFRTAPSAGGLYPLELYVTTADGVFRYDPHKHHLLVMSADDARFALYEAALQQEALRQAPAIFVMTAVYERTAKKYGSERSPRYVHLEAGHAAQNLLLEAVALGLGAVPIGAFEDERIQEVLAIPADHKPLYLIPIGHIRDG